jgi:hypothetical protein
VAAVCRARVQRGRRRGLGYQPRGGAKIACTTSSRHRASTRQSNPWNAPTGSPDPPRRLAHRSRSTRANGRAVPPGKCGRYLISRPGRGNRILGTRLPAAPTATRIAPAPKESRQSSSNQMTSARRARAEKNAAVESLERILGIPWAQIPLERTSLGKRILGTPGGSESLDPWVRILGPLEANPWIPLGANPWTLLGANPCNPWGANPWNEILGLNSSTQSLERILGIHSAVIG